MILRRAQENKDSQLMISTKELFWDRKGIEINYSCKKFFKDSQTR
jgi:hypothetical protein